MIKAEDMKMAFETIVRCGLSEEKAHQEIGFALDAINSNPKLSRFPVSQINNVVSMVGYTGLSLNPSKQEAVLVDYQKGKGAGLYFTPMYRGLLKIAIAEGAIVAANTKVVYDGDEIEINAASMKAPVRHIVKSFSSERTPIVTYCVLLLPSGVEMVTLFYEDEYEKAKKAAGTSTVHKMWSDEMRKKSALKRALKTVASDSANSKIDDLIHLDNKHYELGGAQSGQIETSKKNTKHTTKFELTPSHPKYEKAIAAIANRKQSFESIASFCIVSNQTKSMMEQAVAEMRGVEILTEGHKKFAAVQTSLASGGDTWTDVEKKFYVPDEVKQLVNDFLSQNTQKKAS